MSSLYNGTIKLALAALCLVPALGTTKEIVLETESGESYALHVEAHDTFDSVIDTLTKIAECRTLEGDFSDSHLKVFIPSTSQSMNFRIAKTARAALRSYAAGVTSAQAEDIAYIVRTLANSSLPKIKGAESNLKKTGQRIDDIHPLNFLACIFSNEELKVCARIIKGRSWVWKGFVNGSVVTLTEENGKNNVAPYLKDFAARVNIDVNLLIPLQQSGRWEKLVTTLIDTVPREGEVDRYNH